MVDRVGLQELLDVVTVLLDLRPDPLVQPPAEPAPGTHDGRGGELGRYESAVRGDLCSRQHPSAIGFTFPEILAPSSELASLLRPENFETQIVKALGQPSR